jgi:phage-related protein
VEIRPKILVFRGSSLSDVRSFPAEARRQAGHQLDEVQQGNDPDDWKPMSSIGSGVKEIRIRGADGAFRVIYIATFPAKVYVLHCFQKKSQKTSRKDLALAISRYKDLVKELA